MSVISSFVIWPSQFISYNEKVQHNFSSNVPRDNIDKPCTNFCKKKTEKQKKCKKSEFEMSSSYIDSTLAVKRKNIIEISEFDIQKSFKCLSNIIFLIYQSGSGSVMLSMWVYVFDIIIFSYH